MTNPTPPRSTADGLEKRLRQMAQPGFYPFSRARDETRSDRPILEGFVKFAEVPEAAKAVCIQAADALAKVRVALELAAGGPADAPTGECFWCDMTYPDHSFDCPIGAALEAMK